MTSDSDQGETVTVPPSISFEDFERFLAEVGQQAPLGLDDISGNRNAGAVRALQFLGLLHPDGTVDPDLRAIAEGDSVEEPDLFGGRRTVRDRLLRDRIARAYEEAFVRFPNEPTKPFRREAFADAYRLKGQALDNALAFFEEASWSVGINAFPDGDPRES